MMDGYCRNRKELTWAAIANTTMLAMICRMPTTGSTSMNAGSRMANTLYIPMLTCGITENLSMRKVKIAQKAPKSPERMNARRR